MLLVEQSLPSALKRLDSRFRGNHVEVLPLKTLDPRFRRKAKALLLKATSSLGALLVLAGCWPNPAMRNPEPAPAAAAPMPAPVMAPVAQPMPAAAARDDDDALHVLFLGDGGHHRPVERLRDIATPMLNRGIVIHYTEDLGDLELPKLRLYDAVMLYANYEREYPPEYEQALLDYVAEGGGFVPVHSASANFRRSDRFVELVGGQFASHGTGVFRTRIAEPNHEIMQGFEGFESWDETYVHQRHNEVGRTVLEYRENEPYTWTRTHGLGRVFYTAWGHDQRTWSNPGFHDLLERGIRWAAKQDVQMALRERDIVDPFRYRVLDVPFPPPHRVRMEYEATVGPMDRRSNNPRFYDMQLAMSPEESMERMIVPPGFRVELFASEPDVVKPISMQWDERGRLWVIESVEYPYTRELWPDGGGKDRIRILEDTNGDGRADKFTEFASGFNVPTSLAFANGGIIVTQAPQTLFLKDTDGDDRADVRQVLFEGWSQRDTHAGPNNLQYGLDNWIWGVLGYSGFDGTVGGERHNFTQGVYRFRQDGSKLELIRRTSNNTWGLGFNEQGAAFTSTANGNPSTHVQFPQARYSLLPEMQPQQTIQMAEDPRMIVLSNEFRQVDWVGAYTAGAGHALYTARTWPREYWNRIAFVTEATGHLVGEFELSEAGSGYDSWNPRNLIASDDQWFAPVLAEVGPDGHVWIADWYNYVGQHNAESDRQTPSPGNAYANPLRDTQHGRIYRIVWEGAPAEERMSLGGASPQRLVETLKHHNMLWRKHAQRLLVERGQTDVVPSLIALLQDQTVDETGLNVGAIHAIWTLHGLGELDGSNPEAEAAVRTALQHPSGGVRRNAVQALAASPANVTAMLPLLQDPDLQVRLATLVALAEEEGAEEVGRAIFAALRDPASAGDRSIREAGALAAAVHSRGFLAAAREAGIQPTEAPVEPQNLVANPSFEQIASGEPTGWTTRTTAGTAQFSIARGEGRNGGNAIKITSTAGADASWVSPQIPLKANTRYQIGAWMRTRGMSNGSGRGAQIAIDGMQPAQTRINPAGQENPWTFYERTFTTGDAPIPNARFAFSIGGGGSSIGEVWADQVVLHELGPAPGQSLESIVRLVAARDRG